VDAVSGVRLTVVASRRVGGAVQRNRAKRLLREAARTLAWRPGLDVVLVARADCAGSDLTTVATELTRLATLLDLVVHDLADGGDGVGA
jgi:ribonuclease P protein component